jgi:hypothetical protein
MRLAALQLLALFVLLAATSLPYIDQHDLKTLTLASAGRLTRNILPSPNAAVRCGTLHEAEATTHEKYTPKRSPAETNWYSLAS